MLFGRRLRDLPVRAKLLLLTGLPLLESVLLLLAFNWAYRNWSAAFEEALGWQRHAAAEMEIRLLAEAYVDGVGDQLLDQQHDVGEAEAARKELQRASAASLEMSRAFSVEEQEAERHLSSLLEELVSRGTAVGNSKAKFASLQEFYDGPLRAFIDQRVSEERQGSQRALDSARRLSRMMRVGAFIASVATLLGVLLLCLYVAEKFSKSILEIQGLGLRIEGGELDRPIRLDSKDEIGQLAASLNEMAAVLRRQRNNQFGFLAGVAHDLRNPLGPLKLTTDALLASPSMPEEALRQRLSLISRQVERLDRLVGDLLDAAKIEAGELELRLASADLRPVLREVAELYEAVSAKHSIRLSVPEEPVVARIDLTRIAQVLNNLVSNAIKYSPAGGQVELSLARQGQWAVLSVADQGVGIEPEALGAVFEPFRRLSSTKEIVPGVGLGLAISRRIVAAHGGTIDVQSTPGHGSSFRVRLPLTAP